MRPAQYTRRSLPPAAGMVKRAMAPIPSVNQIAPSEPAASHPGFGVAVGMYLIAAAVDFCDPTAYSAKEPASVTRPIRLVMAPSVNHSAPSGPVVSPRG